MRLSDQKLGRKLKAFNGQTAIIKGFNKCNYNQHFLIHINKSSNIKDNPSYFCLQLGEQVFTYT